MSANFLQDSITNTTLTDYQHVRSRSTVCSTYLTTFNFADQYQQLGSFGWNATVAIFNQVYDRVFILGQISITVFFTRLT
jgi:hypothetical protein